jgi:hypothetical protein
MSNPDGGPRPSARSVLLACGALVALGTVLRAIPCGNDFWMDEIWTYVLVQGLESATGVFSELHHSNNHHLNTLLFYWLGDRESWAIYRVPALLSGVGSVVVGIALAWRRGRNQAWIAAVLFSLCFALIQFSSEARGYAPGVFFCLLALLCLELDFARQRRWLPLAFGLCVVLAFLSQLTSLFFLAGAIGYGALRAWGRGDRGAVLATGCARLALLPSLAFAALYWVDLRHLLVEGGEPVHAGLLTAQTVGYALGLPVRAGWAVPMAASAALLLAACLVRLYRAGDPIWALHAVTIVLAPAAVLAVLRPDVIAARYFLLGSAFYLLALADGLAHLAERGRAATAAVATLLLLFAIGNGIHIAAFFRDGRGSYLAALEMMAASKGGDPVRIGGDHDFRNYLVYRFYLGHLPPNSRLEFIPHDRWPEGGLDWLIVHGEHRFRPGESQKIDDYGNVYERSHRFEKAGVSGFYWDLYRATGERMEAAP